MLINSVSKTLDRLRELVLSLKLYARMAHILPASLPKTRFVIISEIRSGSTLLCSLLNSHPNAICFFEPFHGDLSRAALNRPGFVKLSSAKHLLSLRGKNPYKYVEKFLWGKLYDASVYAVGFKLIYTQGRQDSWWKEGRYEDWWSQSGVPPIYGSPDQDLWKQLGHDHGVKIIHLVRTNILAGIVSAKTAQETGSWGDGASGGYKPSNRILVSVSTDELELSVNSMNRHIEETRALFNNNPFLEITYEDLILNREKTLGEVLEFLDLSPIALSPSTRKMRSSKLAVSISNIDELVASTRGTALESLVDRWIAE